MDVRQVKANSRWHVALIGTMLALSLAACGDKPVDKGAAARNAPLALQPVEAPASRSEGAAKAANEPADSAARVNQNRALAAKVKSAGMAEPGLRQLTVDVSAADGEVTLFGTADSGANRDKAAHVASTVEGVKSVKNTLVIVAGS